MITHSGMLANPHSTTVAGAAQALPHWKNRQRDAPASRLTRLRYSLSTSKRRELYHASHLAQKHDLQNTSTTQPYHLTLLHFPNYITVMENELNALESKLVQLIQVSGQLRRENHQLRQELAQALSHNRLCNDKIDDAKARLEKLLHTLPEELS